jgi:hypothetical protein
MTLVIKIKEFEFESEKLGKIRIGMYSILAASKLEKLINDFKKVSGIEFIKYLMSVVGYRYNESTGDFNKENISIDETDLLSEQELEEFANLYIQNNDWLFERYSIDDKKEDKEKNKTNKKKISIAQLPDEKNSEYLKRLFIGYNKNLMKWISNISSSLKSPFSISDKSSELLKNQIQNNVLISGMLGNSLKDFQINLPQYNRESYHPLRTIPNLESATKGNESYLLEELINTQKKMMPIIAESVSLIKSMNDTAIQMVSRLARNAKSSTIFNSVMVSIGVLTLITTLVVSIIDFKASQKNNTQNKLLLDNIMVNLQLLSSSSIKNDSLTNDISDKYIKLRSELDSQNLNLNKEIEDLGLSVDKLIKINKKVIINSIQSSDSTKTQ